MSVVSHDCWICIPLFYLVKNQIGSSYDAKVECERKNLHMERDESNGRSTVSKRDGPPAPYAVNAQGNCEP